MLAGQLVGLRAVTLDDLPTLLEFRNRPEYRQYFREYRELNLEMQRRWFETTVNNDNSVRMFSIVELSTGRLLGACGLCYIDWLSRSADFSIYIGADNLYIDRRFAPDCGSVLLRYGFEELGLNRVWAEIYDIDAAKKELFDTLGFTLESQQSEHHWTQGRWVDSLFYGLLSREFRSAS